MTTSQLTTERLRFERSQFGSVRLRSAQPSPSATLAYNHLRRAVARQALPVAVIAVLAAAAGVAFHASQGAEALQALQWWIPAALAAGLTVGFAREAVRNTITSPASLERNPGHAVIGAAPTLSAQALRLLPPDQRSALDCVVYQPASSFAGAFRDLQDAMAGNNLVSVIGVAADDGASTAALCAAVSAQQQNRKVIVVDCDLRRRGLTRMLGSRPSAGVLEAADLPEDWRGFVEEETETGLHVLPAAAAITPWDSLIGSRGFAAMLDHLCAAYELVILDCPPALASAEGPMIASMADLCVLVAGWDKTPVPAITRSVRVLHRGGSRVPVSVFVNRAPATYRHRLAAAA